MICGSKEIIETFGRITSWSHGKAPAAAKDTTVTTCAANAVGEEDTWLPTAWNQFFSKKSRFKDLQVDFQNICHAFSTHNLYGIHLESVLPRTLRDLTWELHKKLKPFAVPSDSVGFRHLNCPRSSSAAASVVAEQDCQLLFAKSTCRGTSVDPPTVRWVHNIWQHHSWLYGTQNQCWIHKAPRNIWASSNF